MKKLLALVLLLPLSAFAHPPHGGPRVHVVIGGGYYGPRYYGPGWYPYAYGPAYYPYPYYDAPPTVIYTQPDVATAAPPPTYWYYCDSAKAYYPYVRQCPEAWRAVPASPQQQATQDPSAPQPLPPATSP